MEPWVPISCLFSFCPLCSFNAASNHLNWSLQNKSRNHIVWHLCLKIFKGVSLPENKPQLLELLTESPGLHLVLWPHWPLVNLYPFTPVSSILVFSILRSSSIQHCQVARVESSFKIWLKHDPVRGIWTGPDASCSLNTFSSVHTPWGPLFGQFQHCCN